MKQICLAAGSGSRLHPHTSETPKCMVEVAGRPLLSWQVSAAAALGIDEFVAVVGHLGARVDVPGVETVTNPQYATTNMVESLWCAEAHLREDVVVSYGDIVYEHRVLEALLNTDAPLAITVDRGWRRYWEVRHAHPVEDAESLRLTDESQLAEIGQPIADLAEPEAQYMGLIRAQGEGVAWLRAAYQMARMVDGEGRSPFRCGRSVARMYMTDLLQGMVLMGFPIHAVSVTRGWLEIDTPEDLELAREVAGQSEAGTLTISS